MITRRAWLGQMLGGAALALTAGSIPALAEQRRAARAAATDITVYKSPTCGCCEKWVDHLRANGFRVTTRDLEDVSEVKATLGVPAALQSCHTGVVGAYVVEGHVPADLIARMLKERPTIRGLAVPGMPVGSPGMEVGTRKDTYAVIAFDKAGKTSVYATR